MRFTFRANALQAKLAAAGVCLAFATQSTGAVFADGAQAFPTAGNAQVQTTTFNEPFALLSDEASNEEGDEEETGDADTDSVSAADYKKLFDRVEEMETSWEKYQDKIAEDSAAKKKKPTMKIGGRVHLDNWNFVHSDAGTNFLETGDPLEDPENRWDFRRLRIEMSGDIPQNMLYRLQIDFNNPSSPEMKDAYIGFKNLPGNHTLLLGNQKRPLGLDHLNSSRHNVFAERPLVVEAFNEDARRLGACFYGYSDDEMFNWRAGGFLLENISTDGRYRGDFSEAGLYSRLAASPWYDETSGGRGYLHLALAGSINQTDPDGQTDTDSNTNEARFRTRPQARSDSRWWNTNRILGAENYEQFGYEFMLNIGSVQVTSEYYGTWVGREAAGGFSGEDLFFHGGYIFASYFLTGEHIPLDRVTGTIDRVKPFENFFLVDRCTGGTGSGMGALAAALRYDYLDLSDSDIRGGDGHTVTAGLNWYWTAYSKVQFNTIWGSINNGGQGQENSGPSGTTVPLVAGVDGDFTALGFRFMADY
ncbi:Phosphate-selective porin O and P [Novipirellula galeiformis]|uniref:Phosphate-selective porin O and P n=1 Tax=Novipirellula galeiformis TaxID=2528004 RepID=A0A5C6CRE7_9BACT|nr:porin [Novipirellula galeiformis]TWU26475.1 Phosphate-selective porin O and P [Novipirellula galeiformis]